MLGNIIGGFVVCLVGITLAPSVANAVQHGVLLNTSGGEGTANNVLTGASSTIFALTTLFYCLAVASAGIGIATMGLRNSGMM